jgi:hypothetical protein
MNNITELLEDVLLRKKLDMDLSEGSTKAKIHNVDGNLVITKETDVSQFLKEAKVERANFKMSKNTQDHYTKVASIPLILFESIMKEADRLEIHDAKERQKFLIQQVRSNFSGFLTIPENFIRS